MAESLFYQLAAQKGKSRAGRKQAVAHYNTLIRHIGLDPTHYQIADGSGLSLYNYLSPELLGRMLRYAYKMTTFIVTSFRPSPSPARMERSANACVALQLRAMYAPRQAQ